MIRRHSLNRGIHIASLVALVAVLASITGFSAAAITNGERDGNGHPGVGTVFGISAICSGTLIAPKIFLTAAHCTRYFEEQGEPIWVTFDPAPVIDPDLTHPFFVTDHAIRGTPHDHPDFTGARFGVGDIAVVVLEKAVRGIEPAQLPQLGQLDRLIRKRGIQDTAFTTVGYGAVDSTHAGGVAHGIYDFDRRVATTQLVGFLDPDNGTSKCKDTGSCELLELSGAPGTGGGTCFGDSGGPSFLDDSDIVAVVTTGVHGNNECVGDWFAYRTDTPAARAFLADYVDLP